MRRVFNLPLRVGENNDRRETSIGELHCLFPSCRTARAEETESPHGRVEKVTIGGNVFGYVFFRIATQGHSEIVIYSAAPGLPRRNITNAGVCCVKRVVCKVKSTAILGRNPSPSPEGISFEYSCLPRKRYIISAHFLGDLQFGRRGLDVLPILTIERGLQAEMSGIQNATGMLSVLG